MNVRTKLIGIIVLGAALLAPVAQAQRPDDRADRAFPAAEQSWPVLPDDRADRRIAPAAQSSPINGDYPGYWRPGTAPIDTSVRPDDRADRKLPFATSDGGLVTGENKRDVRVGVNYEPTLVASRPHGFDWGDGLIGGLGGVGLALLLTGSAFLFMNQRQKARTV
jgi:hypothetical protein